MQQNATVRPSLTQMCVCVCPVWEGAGFPPDVDRLLYFLLQDQFAQVGLDLKERPQNK